MLLRNINAVNYSEPRHKNLLEIRGAQIHYNFLPVSAGSLLSIQAFCEHRILKEYTFKNYYQIRIFSRYDIRWTSRVDIANFWGF